MSPYNSSTIAFWEFSYKLYIENMSLKVIRGYSSRKKRGLIPAPRKLGLGFGDIFVKSYRKTMKCATLMKIHAFLLYSFVFFSWANMVKYVWFFRPWEYAFDQKKTENFSHQKLFRLLDLTTFHSDHPRKKSGIQLRSQIVWTFHFWSPFYDRRHPQAVRLQSLKIFSGTKKTHTIGPWKKDKTICTGTYKGNGA